MEECTKIRELEKEERLYIARERQKRYGINNFNEEEKKRMNERQEERLEIAQAKANYWKLYKEGGKVITPARIDGKRKEMWEQLR